MPQSSSSFSLPPSIFLTSGSRAETRRWTSSTRGRSLLPEAMAWRRKDVSFFTRAALPFFFDVPDAPSKMDSTPFERKKKKQSVSPPRLLTKEPRYPAPHSLSLHSSEINKKNNQRGVRKPWSSKSKFGKLFLSFSFSLLLLLQQQQRAQDLGLLHLRITLDGSLRGDLAQVCHFHGL